MMVRVRFRVRGRVMVRLRLGLQAPVCRVAGHRAAPVVVRQVPHVATVPDVG